MVEIGVGVGSTHNVTKFILVFIAVQPYNTVFSSPGLGPLVLVKMYWPLGGGGVCEGALHDEPV